VLVDDNRQMRYLLQKAPVVTSTSRHLCRDPEPISDKTLVVPLLPPINQWGHLPMPIQPLSRHAISVLARPGGPSPKMNGDWACGSSRRSREGLWRRGYAAGSRVTW